MTDLYAPRRTAVEERRIAEGRGKLQQLLRHAPYSNGQSSTYGVMPGHFTETRRRRQYDVFALRGVTEALDKQWREDERRHGWIISTDSTKISIPHDYYLSKHHFPIDIDATLAAKLAICFGTALVFGYARYAFL